MHRVSKFLHSSNRKRQVIKLRGTERVSTVPPWYADYFEPKTIKPQQTQEEFFLPPSLLLKDSQIKKPVSGKETALEIKNY